MSDPIQLSLPIMGEWRCTSKRLWILASHNGSQLSPRHHYLFLDPEDGSPIVGTDDLILVRLATGIFNFYAPRSIGSAANELRKSIPSVVMQAGCLLRRRGTVRDVMALSSKPGRLHGRSNNGQRRREDARGTVEQIIIRLSMEPRGRGELRTLDDIAAKLPGNTHPTARALLKRERADALSQRVRRNPRLSIGPAVSGYYAAMVDFATFGSPHQLEATRSNASVTSMCDQMHLHDIPQPPEPRLSSLGFSSERFCGFPIEMDCPLEACEPSAERSGAYESFGEVEVDDRSIADSLMGLSSSFLRLAATTSTDGFMVTIQTGVVDEMRGFLRMIPLNTFHDDIEAIKLCCDTLAFIQAPCAFYPESYATFVGRSIKGCHHRIYLEATFTHSETMSLSFVLRANENGQKYFI